jgi:Spy/CpxP family protein refolding chaperone
MNKFPSLKQLKQMAVAAALLSFCGLPAIANAQQTTPSNSPSSVQGQDQPPPMHAQRGDDELSKLNLSDDQTAQVKKIHQDTKAQMETIQRDTTLTAEQKQTKMKQLHKASHEQVKQLLTPEQRQQMKADEMARKAAKQQSGQSAAPQQ